MAATETVSQSPQSLQPRHGVITLFGYGITVRVERGHLILQDGIGTARCEARFPRVGHGIRRLVVIGNDGCISLAALRWLADQDAAFVMLERDGTVLCTTGPVRPSDARLRRFQASAVQSGADVVIARELISRKLAGQEQVARDKLHSASVVQAIADSRLALAEAETIDAIRSLESQGAAAYWSAWRDVAITFPKHDLFRTPEHWRAFGTRKSELTGSPRLATNPANAMLNYLYAVLESEARLAVAALGLDPGLGFIHVDTPARDSLACDVMEVARPQIDRYVLDWILQQPLRREWFFEQRDGNCRLMATLAVRLSETAPMWARAVAPMAEWIARQLWTRQRKPTNNTAPPTRLTQRHKREAKGSASTPPPAPLPQRENICRSCGKTIETDSQHCFNCNRAVSAERLTQYARLGRVVAHSSDSKARRSETMRRQTTACHKWQPSEQPSWLTQDTYTKRIQPALENVSNRALASALAVSLPYAADIKRGKRIPHPRLWMALAELVGVSSDSGT